MDLDLAEELDLDLGKELDLDLIASQNLKSCLSPEPIKTRNKKGYRKHKMVCSICEQGGHTQATCGVNNAKAKGILASYGAVTEKEKELILLGMKVQQEITINWLSVGPGADDAITKSINDDTFIEEENGGGWEEQVPAVLQHLAIVQSPTIDLISSDKEVVKRSWDTLSPTVDLSEEDSDEDDEIAYSIDEEIAVHTLRWFKENRHEQYQFSEEIVAYMNEHPEQNNIVIKAEEKTGKREMVEIIALLTSKDKENSYFTAFNAKSIDVQIDEIERYGVRAVKCNRIEKMHEQVDELECGSIVHVDELDYGSGKLQSLSPLITAVNFTKIFYSATTHELEKEMNGTNYTLFTFRPHGNYRGAQWFLNNGLVRKSQPFVFSEDNASEEWLTEHGESLTNMLTDEKPVGIVRLTKRGVYKSIKERFEKESGENKEGRYTDKLGMDYIFVDSKVKDTFNPAKIGEITKKTLIFINQCWRRSTELKGHEKIFFMHDDRMISHKGRSGVAYSSLSQAVSRAKHYDKDGHKIIIYTDENAFKISCGKVSGEGHKLYNRQGLSETNKLGSAYA